MIPLVCIVGWSRAGKTSLIERLLPVLKGRGVRVAAVKHHPHGDGDQEGKDTERLWRAGAERVFLLGREEMRVRGRGISLQEIRERFVKGVDLVIAEGFKGERCPKIEVFRRGVGEGPLVEREKGIIAVVSKEPLSARVPVFHPEEVERIADFIQEHILKGRPRRGVELSVDGEAVPLNPFVEGLFYRTLEAMVTSLKGCEAPKEVILRWQKV